MTKFTVEISEGLSKPLRALVGEMLFGVQASQDVKLSNIARSLKEETPLIKTEDRLSRNLKAEELEGHRSERLASLGSRRVEANTVLCRDLSDVRKEYAEKMEYRDRVWDGSEGEVHAGYGLLRVTAAAYFAARSLGQKLKLKILCEKLLIISRRFFAIPLSDSMRWPMASSKS